jgi:hypothetical protein
MYVCSPSGHFSGKDKMTISTLCELVELWREVNSTKHQPSIFISQKFKNCEDDKLEVYEGRMALDQEEDGEGWILFSTDTITRVRRTFSGTPLKIYQYKRIARGNRVKFQLKPPVKSQFTAISGPYKAM